MTKILADNHYYMDYDIRYVTFENSANNNTVVFSPTAKDNSRLQRYGDGRLERTYRNGVKVFFDPTGKQISVKDRVGRETSFSYEGEKIKFITDPVGKVITYNYSDGRLTSIKDPAERTTNFYYTGNLLTQVRYQDGSAKFYTYDAQGLLLSETNERGKITQYQYNQYNRLEKVIRPDTTEIAVNDGGSASAGNNFTGGTVGQIKSYRNGELVDGIKDARGIQTVFDKDYKGYIYQITDANGLVTKVKRDDDGKPTEITRPDETVVTFKYDPTTGDLLSQSDTALNLTTSQVYDPFGNVLSSTNGRGFTSTVEYDPTTGLVLLKTNPLQNSVSYSYNNLGLPLSITDPETHFVSYTYDASGNVQTVTDQALKITTYTRDTAGNVIAVTNANSQVTHYEYDLFNKLTAVTTPKLPVERTEYTYLPTGELSQIKDPLENITSFVYDDLGRLLSKTDPLGFSVSRSYDNNGNVLTEMDPNQNLKIFVYDNLNRLTQKTLPDNVYSLAYDIRGNTIQVKNNHSQIDFMYDVGSRLTNVTSTGLGSHALFAQTVSNFSYDQNGNRTQMSGPTGTFNYGYDGADRLRSLINFKGEIYSFNFDNANRLTLMTRPGSTTTLTFDSRNFITNVLHQGFPQGAVQIADTQYVMDAIGNRTLITTNNNQKTFGYDDNNQLTSATNPEAPQPSGMQSETFEYDKLANRTADQGGSYAFDNKKQRLQEDYRFFYIYDNNGNLITKTAKFGMIGETTNFIYTSENQLINIKSYTDGSNPSSIIKDIIYTYDALGRRIEKKVIDYTTSDVAKTFTRRFSYDGQEILAEYDSNNNLLARYTHSGLRTDDVLAVDITQAGVDQKVAQTTGTFEYLKDAQGTITDVADTSGNKLQHYVYSAFGTLLAIQDASANEITSNPILNTAFTYTGREKDSESGYYYYRARYYDSQSGRFLQKDPEHGVINQTSTVFNMYIYTSNMPTILSDPYGRWAVGLGLSFGGGTVGWGFNISGGWAFAYDPSSGKFDTGPYGAISFGYETGPNARLQLQVLVAPEAKDISVFSGPAVQVGFESGGVGFTAGAGVNVPVQSNGEPGKPYYNLNLGLGGGSPSAYYYTSGGVAVNVEDQRQKHMTEFNLLVNSLVPSNPSLF